MRYRGLKAHTSSPIFTTSLIDTTYVVASQLMSQPSAESYFIILLFLAFALCERKSQKQKKSMYLAAGSPEPVEGQAQRR